MNKKLAIIGAGGHGKVVGEIALLNKYKSINFFDDDLNLSKDKFPFSIVDTTDFLEECRNNYDAFFVAIGDNKIRSDKIEWLKKLKVNIVSLIHPNATISKFTHIEIGTCIMANAVVNAGSIIKEGVIINTSASVDHDCIIDSFVHISPNSSISGNVKIEKFSHLGTGTCVHPGVHISSNVKTAIGSKIFSDISPDTVYKK